MMSRTLHRELSTADFHHYYPPGENLRFAGALVVVLDSGNICGYGHQPAELFLPPAKLLWLQVQDPFVSETELLGLEERFFYAWARITRWESPHDWEIEYHLDQQSLTDIPVTILEP